MSRLAVAAMEDKARGLALPSEPLVVKPIKSPEERRSQELLDVMLMHAGSSPVEENFAQLLDDALTERGDSNVFEVVRNKFVDMALPVDGALYQGVVMYAVEHY